MKKVLLASTMLVATASVAAADITFNGYGRFGLLYAETDEEGVSDTRIEQRFRLNIVGTAETDGGVQFGARVRIENNDDSDGNGNASSVRAPEFNVSAGGFRLDVGNTSDVIDSGDVVDFYGYGVGLTSFLEQSTGWFTGFPVSGISGSSSVVPTIKARYSYDAFTVAASYTDNALDDTREEWQIGAGYSFGDWNVGAAFGNEDFGTDDNDFWAASVGGMISGVGVTLLVGDSDIQDDVSYGATVMFPIGAATEIRFAVSDNGMDSDNPAVVDGDEGDETAYAIGFRHSLGGGVSLRGGVGENSFGDTVGDLGVIFDF
jgi:outer membrane protein OmpU